MAHSDSGLRERIVERVRTCGEPVIKADSMPELKQTGVASGLYFDRSDYNPDLYYTRMSWKAAEPKW